MLGIQEVTTYHFLSDYLKTHCDYENGLSVLLQRCDIHVPYFLKILNIEI